MSRSWSRPSRCSIVACRSWRWTLPATGRKPNSSVSPWVIPGLHAAAGEPGAEALGLVLAAVGLDRRRAREVLAPRGAAEFARPDDQRVVEQAARLEVLDQAGDGPVRPGAASGQGVADVAVVVPAADRHLDEADARLAEPAGEQAGPAVLVGLRLADSVQISWSLAFRPRGRPASGVSACIRNASSNDSIIPSIWRSVSTRSSSRRFILCTKSSRRRCTPALDSSSTRYLIAGSLPAVGRSTGVPWWAAGRKPDP